MILARERASRLQQERCGTAGSCGTTDGLQHGPGPLVHRQSGTACRLWQRQPALYRGRPIHQGHAALALALAIEQDLAAGRIPAAIVCSVGATGTTAIDPVEAIATIASAHGIWLHVDAAMAGSAMLLPEYRHLWQGVEQADSLAWNPHKWMGTILDTALFYVRDVPFLERVMSTNPAYLRSAADGQVTQYRDWGILLGRRFRALRYGFTCASMASRRSWRGCGATWRMPAGLPNRSQRRQTGRCWPRYRYKPSVSAMCRRMPWGKPWRAKHWISTRWAGLAASTPPAQPSCRPLYWTAAG